MTKTTTERWAVFGTVKLTISHVMCAKTIADLGISACLVFDPLLGYKLLYNKNISCTFERDQTIDFTDREAP